jgi:hypothetical protein
MIPPRTDERRAVRSADRIAAAVSQSPSKDAATEFFLRCSFCCCCCRRRRCRCRGFSPSRSTAKRDVAVAAAAGTEQPEQREPILLAAEDASFPSSVAVLRRRVVVGMAVTVMRMPSRSGPATGKTKASAALSHTTNGQKNRNARNGAVRSFHFIVIIVGVSSPLFCYWRSPNKYGRIGAPHIYLYIYVIDCLLYSWLASSSSRQPARARLPGLATRES